MNILPSEQQPLIGTSAPTDYSAGTQLPVSVITMDQQQRAQFIVDVYANGADTAEVKLIQGDGVTTKDIDGKTYTIPASQTAVVTLNVQDTDLDINNGFEQVGLVLVNNAAASMTVKTLAGAPRYNPDDISINPGMIVQ